MYVGRDRHFGDPAFAGVPVEGLLDEAYVARRAELAPGLTGAATAASGGRNLGLGRLRRRPP